MRLTFLQRAGLALALGLSAVALVAGAVSVGAAPFDGRRTQFVDPGFQQAWSRTDHEAVRGGRTWYWGPGPWFDYAEFYRQGQNGLRQVQYFDKARMERNIAGDTSGPYAGITNGLLVKELVSGRMQLGNDPFDTDSRPPADVPVAGNPRESNTVTPAYGTFQGLATLDNGYKDPQRLGERISTTIDRGGNLSLRPELALPETEIVQYNSITGHNIPRVFWEFLNQQGPIYTNGRVSSGPVVDWLFAMGLPITDAYWTRAQIGATEQDVLVQLFERRVLTYVPSNPAGYKVEMGNVGQHYFQWRYAHLGTPWASPELNPQLLYASNQDTGSHWELYRYVEGRGPDRLTNNSQETVAFSWRRTWDPNQLRLLTDSRRDNPERRRMFTFGPVAIYDGDRAWNADVRRVFEPRLSPDSNDYNGSYSPDGTKIVFVSDREGGQELYMTSALIPLSGVTRLTSDGCVNETPTWAPDGRTLYWVNNCDGDFELVAAELAYSYDSQYGAGVRLVNQRKLTDNSVDDRYARVSPDGRSIAYSTQTNGVWDIAILDIASGVSTVFSSTTGNDEAPTWSADGRSIAFASDRDGDYEIFVMDVDGRNTRQLTFNNAQDRWPLWAQ
jgi:hypothetical protein